MSILRIHLNKGDPMLLNLLQNGKRDSGGVIMLISFFLMRAGIADATQENVGLVIGAAIHVIGWVHFFYKRYKGQA